MFKLPTKESLLNSKWLKWLGPSIAHPSLWRWQRHSVSLGVSVGIFFGLLIPLAQIPLSAIFAVIFRANVSVAAISTLVSNPLTFPGIYYGAFKFGEYLLGGPTILLPLELQVVTDEAIKSNSVLEFLLTTGKPVALGLLCFAVFFSVFSYFFTSLIWGVRTRIKWMQRQRRNSNVR